MNFYKNAEGYNDPTAGKALTNIAREERQKRKTANNPKPRPQRQYKKPDADLGDPHHALANAIIVQAVDEYRAALRIQHKVPSNARAKAAIEEIEHFFRSEWFSFLTRVDGEMLIRKLKEEAK